MATIYGDVADGDTLVVLAVGPGADVARAAKYLETLTPAFSKSSDTLGLPGGLTVPLTWPVVVQLISTFPTTWQSSPRLQAWIDEQIQRRTVPGDVLNEVSFSYIPDRLRPYPWQISGAALIASIGTGLISDEPGTGKTITAILGLTEWNTNPVHGRGAWENGRPTIVVCPAAVVDAWIEAWRAWVPFIDAVAWRGPDRYDLADTASVYVTSFETARADASEVRTKSGRALLNLDPHSMVIDECHLIKNATAMRSAATRRISAQVDKAAGCIVAMSGTPITHHPGDLFPTLKAIEPRAYPAKERWVRRYCMTLPGEYDDQIFGLLPSHEPEFRLTLLGQHRRVAKADVLAQLPPKVYSVRTVDMPERWRKVYDDFEDQMLAELPDGTELQVMDVMSKFGHLSRLASAAADVAVTFGPDVDEQTGLPKRHVHLDLKAPSWKVDALLEILDERQIDAPQGGSGSEPLNARRCEPVVCFAASRQLAVLAGEAAAKAGYRVGYVVGGQSATERTATVAAFQVGELDLICATTGAGGVGITLTAARTVVFLQRPWSLVESLQAEDRCHRIGSEIHDSIEVIDVVARNTLDTRVRAVLRERAGQLADLVQDPRIVTELLGGASGRSLERAS